MGRPLGARIRIRTVFVDYSTAGKCPSFLSRRIHPLRHRIRAFSESSTKKNAGADKGGSDSRFPWNRTIRLRLPANGATVGDHRASGTRLLRRRILRDDFAHILRTRKNETPRHGNRSLISELDSQNDRRLGVKHGSDLVGTSGFCFDSALGLLRVPGGAQALRHITLSRSIPLSPTFDEKKVCTTSCFC